MAADRILVKVEAASLCSSDLMAWKGYMSFMTTVPYCGGHERKSRSDGARDEINC